MQRWNGWGDMDVQMDLPPEGITLLQDLLGKGHSQPDYPLEKFLEHVPDSRLPEHPLISVDPKLRLDHAHGQSLPDWIRMRGGTLQCFPDGVAQPATIEEIQEIEAEREALIKQIQDLKTKARAKEAHAEDRHGGGRTISTGQNQD